MSSSLSIEQQLEVWERVVPSTRAVGLLPLPMHDSGPAGGSAADLMVVLTELLLEAAKLASQFRQS